MNTTSDQPARNRTRAWLIALLLAFVAGFSLAWWLLHQQSFTRPPCPVPPSQTSPSAAAPAAGGAMHGGAGPGDGSPTKLGPGEAGTVDLRPSTGDLDGADGIAPPGGGKSGGDVQGSLGGGGDIEPTASSGHGGGSLDGADIDAGGGRGKLVAGDDQSTPVSAASVPSEIGTQPVTPDLGGASYISPPDTGSDSDKSTTSGNPVVAADYRYDKSGLPHYPNALKVASGTDAAQAAAAAGPNAKAFSVTEIITDDTPDVVADWYHTNLPAGWQQLSMPGAAAMDDATAQSKTPQAGESPVDGMLKQMILAPQLERSRPGIDAARAAGLTVFQPADPTTDHRMIIVIKDGKSGKTGVLLMKKADAS